MNDYNKIQSKKNNIIIYPADLYELPYITASKTTLKHFLKNIYNELWYDEFRKTNMEFEDNNIDYIIEDINNNKNYLCGNSNYIYSNFENLFENNEYTFKHKYLYSATSKRTLKKEKIITKKFSNKRLVRYIEIYCILHGLIKPINTELEIFNIEFNHKKDIYINDYIYNYFENNNKPLKITNNFIIQDKNNIPKEDTYNEMIKNIYNYNFEVDIIDGYIQNCIKINK